MLLIIMASSFLVVVFYSLALFVVTFVTTSLPLMMHLSKNAGKTISLIGVGLMLGCSFIVVLPEAILNGCECPAGNGDGHAATHLESKDIGLAVVIGYLVMLIADSYTHNHSEGHSHGEEHHSNESASDNGKEEVTIMVTENAIPKLRATISGLCLHSFFDGLAIGSSITSSNTSVIHTLFWALLLHKVSASLGVGIFVKQLHVSFQQASRYIATFSAATPVSTVLSALLVVFGSSIIPAKLIGYAFAFSAGTFIYVALTHILPSVGHHVGLYQIACILVGVLIPYFLFVEHNH